MRTIISNKIEIENPTPDILAWCEESLVLDNPEFYKLQRIGKWTGRTPQEIVLYERKGNSVLLPFGCLQDIWGMIKDNEYKVEISPVRSVGYSTNINLYSYQKKAIDNALVRKNGILVMPCGSGKTASALCLIAKIGGRALWLTHTQDLLNQSYNAAKNMLDAEGRFGKITAGRIDIGESITFATIQTISKIDLTDYKDYWDVIVCDECAHTVGGPTKVTQFYKVLSNLTARYKIGLTATPKRADGLERAMFALLGNTIYTVTREDVKDTTCPINVQTIQTGYMPEYNAILLGDGTLNYNALVTDLIKNEERFNLVRDTVNSLSGSALVLANRVDYIQRLADADVGKAVCLSTMGQSKKAKAERKEVLRKLNDGEIDTVYATYQLAKEGLDAPNLRYVVLATPEKDETTVVQSVGRVGRKADGKDYGTVIDFVDSFGMYIGWSKKRQRYYKKLGVEE